MAITKVQEASSHTASGGGTSKTITISTPGAGNTLVLMLCNNNSSGDMVSVSGGGVTWARQATFGAQEIWLGPNSSGSGTTITLTVPNAYERWNANVTEWSGMPSTVTADGGSNGSTSNPANVTPSVTPTVSPILFLASIQTASGGFSAGPSGGFTDLPVTSGNAKSKFAYQIADPASGAYQCGWTNVAGYGTSTAGLYAFAGSAGGGGGGNPWHYYAQAG